MGSVATKRASDQVSDQATSTGQACDRDSIHPIMAAMKQQVDVVDLDTKRSLLPKLKREQLKV